jgi:hypothetical protein
MTFEARYSPEQRDAIWELKQEGLSGSQIAQQCAGGVKGLEPFPISRDIANRIAREEIELHGPPLLTREETLERIRKLALSLLDLVDGWLRPRRRRGQEIDTAAFRRVTSKSRA